MADEIDFGGKTLKNATLDTSISGGGGGGGTTTWKGDYDSGTSYTADDVVLYNGALWYALQNHSNQDPYSGSAYWGVLNAGSNLPNPSMSGQVLKSDYMYTWQTVTPPWILDPYGSEGFAGSPNDGATLVYSTSNSRWEIASGGQLFSPGMSSGDVQFSFYANNSASGGASTISGGFSNTASGYNSTISGGKYNTASEIGRAHV